MPYNTGNPVGSRSPKDLLDNAENLDELVNSPTKERHPDRLGVDRKTWHGMETDFQQFLADSAYQPLGDYDVDGPFTIEYRNQVFIKDGEYYRAAASTDLPYTTTDWATDESSFVGAGDAVLRQDLGSPGGVFLVKDAMAKVDNVAALRPLTGLIDDQVIYLADDGDGGAGLYRVVSTPDPENAPYLFELDNGQKVALGGIPRNVSDLVGPAVETGLVHSRATLSGGGAISSNRNVAITDSDSYTLPDPSGISSGACVSVITGSGAAPTINTFGAENITTSAGGVSSVALTELSAYEFRWNGATWAMIEAGSGSGPGPVSIQLDENALAISNGDSVAPWTGDTGNLSVGAGELELTGTGSVVQMPMLSIGNQGLIFYGSIRSDSPTETSFVRILHSNSADILIYFNYNIGTLTREAGTLSFRSRLSGGSTQDSKVLATGLDFTSNYKFVMEWTRPSGAGLTYVNFYDDNGADLSLVNSGEAPGGTGSAGAEIVSVGVENDTASFTGTTYIQYLQASAPNFTSIGDSICAGHNGYDPDPSHYAGVDNYSSSWQCHLRTEIKAAFPGLRNNFIYNRGVGGETSLQIFDRFDDLLADGAPVVIIGGPNNDYGAAMSYGNRADTLNRMTSWAQDSSATVVLLGAIVPNTAAGSYPANANYYDKWNEDYLGSTRADVKVDIMESGIRQSGERYIDTAIAVDGTHPSVSGYESIGEYIGSQLTPLITVTA
jgi:lysophospholipase L1-like esterase